MQSGHGFLNGLEPQEDLLWSSFAKKNPTHTYIARHARLVPFLDSCIVDIILPNEDLVHWRAEICQSKE